jgi:hypothetical protein
MWGILCKAYAEVQKFSQALDSNPEADLPDMQEDLAMAFTTAKAMVHFHKGGSTEWPEGLARNVVKKSNEEFAARL